MCLARGVSALSVPATLHTQMHHISMPIIHNSDSDDSINELGNSLYHDIGDSDIFLQMWQGTKVLSAAFDSVH
jgi:hypothetical protein